MTNAIPLVGYQVSPDHPAVCPRARLSLMKRQTPTSFCSSVQPCVSILWRQGNLSGMQVRRCRPATNVGPLHHCAVYGLQSAKLGLLHVRRQFPGSMPSSSCHELEKGIPDGSARGRTTTMAAILPDRCHVTPSPVHACKVDAINGNGKYLLYYCGGNMLAYLRCHVTSLRTISWVQIILTESENEVL